MDTIHLICNAHLDPVWQWEWEEGAAEAVSTFRVAADFCEEFDGFIFCHNEVVLYEWVEEYDPNLFKRIQKLVKEGKWHIMGGWYLQPDCNMPSGEAFVRQILLGREYFQEKFKKHPTTAINFDPFGHSRGLVQIMAKSGYDSYLFCRPSNEDCPLPDDLFRWKGYDGSEITAMRSSWFYNSPKGKADEKIQAYIDFNPPHKTGLVLWGIGNHGGGPSREDIVKIARLKKKHKNITIKDSTPEMFFKQIRHNKNSLPLVEKSLNPWAVGCYTSQVLIKQLNRKLENELFITEKMLTAAWVQGLLTKYPEKDLREANKNLAMVQFHDILPGSSVEAVEGTSIRLVNHALEKLSRLKARAFFALSSGQKKAKRNTIPILVYNPHPYNIKDTVSCEFQLEDQQPLENGFTVGKVYHNGKPLPSQMEKEASSLELDWRKKIVFNASLEPSQMNRFDCELIKLKQRPRPKLKASNGKLLFKTKHLSVTVNTRTGLIDSYKIKNKEFLKPNAFQPIVIDDNEDPWSMRISSFDKIIGKFRLMTATQSAEFSGVQAKTLPPVRVIEDGDVRTIIEAVFIYNNSFICQHYILPKRGSQIGIETRIVWNEKDKMLKLNIPLTFKIPTLLGQTAFGIEKLPQNKHELVSQKWQAVYQDRLAATLINEGTYGSSFIKGSLRPTLLRSAAYCAHPISIGGQIIPQDRFLPRIDTGQRIFRFHFNAGNRTQRLSDVEREAMVIAEKPMALSFFPYGEGKKTKKIIELSNNIIQMTAIKKVSKSNDLIVRLFNPTPQGRSTSLAFPMGKIEQDIEFCPFEIRTFKINLRKNALTEVSLDERKIMDNAN